MSRFEDDLARGCLPTGEPLECLYGMGWWTEMPEEEPEPVDLHIAELEAHNAELEAFVERMIEAGDRLSDEVDHAEFCATYTQCDWSNIVAEWRVKHPNPREVQE